MASADRDFDAVWNRITSLEGVAFTSKRGAPVRYDVVGRYSVVRGSGARVPKSPFESALEKWPVAGPSALAGVYAPSVVWAILNDPRVLPLPVV